MKSRTLTLTTGMTLLAVVMPLRLAAQDNANHRQQHHHYQLIDLSTFGGPSSYLAGSNGVNDAVNRVLNNRGTVVGW